MSLWLAIVLPALPLQLATRALEHGAPVVIVDGPAQRPRVAFCNDPARVAGVAPGLKLAAAQALVQPLIAVPRRLEVERAALAALALWACQFSAWVVLRDDHTLLLETGASETYFAGRHALHRRIARGLRALGYRARFGYAATPRAASLIAHARAHGISATDAFTAAALRAALAPLPLALTGWDCAAIDHLHALGLQTIGQVLTLPRAAFNRRFDRAWLTDLDRALGTLPDPQPIFAPPDAFSAQIELPADIVDSAQLMFPAQRLLRQLEGFLRGRDAGTTEIAFSVQHNPRRALPTPPTTFALRLAAPERDAARLVRLLAEHLNRIRLPEPAIALALQVAHLQPFAARNASLLPPTPGADGGDSAWLQLAETLHARLGSERVFHLHPADDHRPEHAFCVMPLAVQPGGQRGALPLPAAPRPLLIVQPPQPLSCRADTPQYGGALALMAGPERIESGWWDLAGPAHGQPRRSVLRDYFVARNARGQTLWVFRELAAPHGWYLHGLFA